VEELDNDEFGSCIGAFGKNRAMARTALSCEHETRGDSKEDDQRFFPPNGDQHLFPIGEEVICKLLKETRAGKTLRFAEKTKKKKALIKTLRFDKGISVFLFDFRFF
jgi:hypothetical protein